ncbi:MAG: FAD-dependent oxidoreductase [Methylotenera sp.]|nr:FAD-dependent oxidoreductase [Methylotenera sp.]
MNRREFLLSLAATPFLICCSPEKKAFSGQLLGANFKAGHQLRSGNLPKFSQTKRTKVAIIGGGISGLSAGWYLQKNGMADYTIFELESEIGGNARSGQNQTSVYPWGAHYLPIPNADAHLLKQFLAECGAITENADSAKPTYNERYLCFSPEERLYINGLWQDGIVPNNGLTQAEKLEMQAFEREMQGFSLAVGSDGKPAFTIPLANSSKDPQFTQLDKISMADYLHSQGWHSAPVHWYANYACRDDYGMHHTHISAWAGIHYFAARRGMAANAENGQELTWPQGNAWLAAQLAAAQTQNIHNNAMAHSINLERHQVTIDVLNLNTQQSTRWLADHVIYATPLHTLPYVLRNQNDISNAARTLQHAPWLVANITINQPELLDSNQALAWDNVIYDSPALGYVVANHQDVRRFHDKSVLTYYQSFGELSNSQARKLLQEKLWPFFAENIVKDLQKAHPDIRQQIENIDIWRWGHAMIYPQVGFLNNAQRLLLNQPQGRLHIAHTDAAGVSIFEEAFAQGTQAAQAILNIIS